jgi:hypothetical protein
MPFLFAVHALAGVLINEVYYDPDPEDDAGNEWIELCNNGTEAVDLSGWWVESGGQEFEACFDIPSASIEAGQYLLIGGPAGDVPGAYSPNLQNGGSETDGVRLVNSAGEVVDTVLYDSPNTNGLPDDLGGTGSTTAPDPSGGHSIGRWSGSADCVDTDESGVDFADYAEPSPGAANPDPGGDTGGGGEEADCTDTTSVKLNEFLSNPEGSDGGLEWVELYNAGGAAIDLSGWVVRGATKSTGGSSVTLATGTVLEAGGFLLVGAGGVGSISLGNGTGGDGVYLECNGVAVDSVIYGTSNSDQLPDESGAVASLLASVPGEGVSLARRADGVDTDDPTVDWTSSSVNTPGAPNQTPQCHPEGGEGLKLNEVLYDPASDDDVNEFVEIVNTGTETVDLEGFSLEAAKSSWSVNATLPASATLAPGEFFVIGGGNVSNQDYDAAKLDLGNGTDGDGVRLLDCEGLVLDTVLYGGAEGDGLVGDGGATDVVDGASAGTSIGRFPDGEDHDVHTDWHPYATPTPGAGNADPGAEDTGGGGDTGPGGDTGTGPGECGPSPDRPDGATCATTGLPLGGLELVAAAVALSRRRRPAS